MRLYSGKIPAISSEVVRVLRASGDIEAESPKNVEADVAAVLTQYVNDEREVNDRTKGVLERTGKATTEYSRVRQLVAQEKGIGVGDEMIDYLLDQMVEMLMHSNNVDEVFVDDLELRRKMAPILKKHTAVDSDVDADVRAQLRHVREGTREWEVEYGRVLEQVKRKRGL